MVSYQVPGITAVKLVNHFFHKCLFVSSHLVAGSAKSLPLPVGDALETSARLFVESKGVEQELPSPASFVPMRETPCRCGHRASPEIRGSYAFGEAAFGVKSWLSRSIFLQESVALLSVYPTTACFVGIQT